MEHLKKAEKDGLAGKDDVHALHDKVQKMTDEFVELVDKTLAQKESEIMQV
jgi:ribosome recycling factor